MSKFNLDLLEADLVEAGLRQQLKRFEKLVARTSSAPEGEMRNSVLDWQKGQVTRITNLINALHND